MWYGGKVDIKFSYAKTNFDDNLHWNYPKVAMESNTLFSQRTGIYIPIKFTNFHSSRAKKFEKHCVIRITYFEALNGKKKLKTVCFNKEMNDASIWQTILRIFDSQFLIFDKFSIDFFRCTVFVSATKCIVYTFFNYGWEEIVFFFGFFSSILFYISAVNITYECQI